MKNMNLHKNFINELGARRKAYVGDVIVALKIVLLIENNISNLNDKLEELEQIFYTIDYLLENKFIIQVNQRTGSSYIPDFNPMNFIKDKNSPNYRTERIHAMPDYIQQYWGKEFLVRPSFFRMIQNGYQTDLEKKDKINFWLPIAIALLGVFGTAIISLLKKIICFLGNL